MAVTWAACLTCVSPLQIRLGVPAGSRTPVGLLPPGVKVSLPLSNDDPAMSAQVTAPPGDPAVEPGTDADGRTGDPISVWLPWAVGAGSSLRLNTTIATIPAAATTTTATIAMIRLRLPPRAGGG